MKAITLTQPFASLVAIGAKRIETRSWATEFRGPLAIHAAKSFPKWARMTCCWEPFRSALAQAGITDPGQLPVGAVIAVCTLVRLQRIKPQELPEEPERSFGDYRPGRYAWILRDVKPVTPPVPARGALGLWEFEMPGGEDAMMLFTGHSKSLILAGKKTQTRRVWDRPRVRIGGVYQCRTELFGKPFAHIKVLAVDQVRLGDISEEDARAEGAAGVEEFIKTWLRIHGIWNPDQRVWRVEFEVVSKEREMRPHEAATANGH